MEIAYKNIVQIKFPKPWNNTNFLYKRLIVLENKNNDYNTIIKNTLHSILCSNLCEPLLREDQHADDDHLNRHGFLNWTRIYRPFVVGDNSCLLHTFTQDHLDPPNECLLFKTKYENVSGPFERTIKTIVDTQVSGLTAV